MKPKSSMIGVGLLVSVIAQLPVPVVSRLGITQLLLPSETVTLPVGVTPALPETVAVKVTGAPTEVGLSDDLRTSLGVALTLTEAVLLPTEV